MNADSPSAGLEVTAQLNHLLMPVDRGARYEDPLQEALAARGLGEVVGGGTMQLQSGEIEYIDVEVALTDASLGIPFVIATLEALGAPKGSKLQIMEGESVREMPFGKAEGVAVYLDGVNLPDAVYATSDVNVVIEELDGRLEGVGGMQSYWQGPRETALYFYGRDAQEMKRLMADFLAAYPLCAGARVVTIAPRAA
jgi:hypothetical protein